MRNTDGVSDKFISNKMTVNLAVLIALMKNRIGSNLDGTDIIIILKLKANLNYNSLKK